MCYSIGCQLENWRHFYNYVRRVASLANNSMLNAYQYTFSPPTATAVCCVFHFLLVQCSLQLMRKQPALHKETHCLKS